MLGILIQLAISWGLLKWLEKKNLSILGLLPTRKRSLHLVLGFLASAIVLSVYTLSIAYLTDNSWSLNPDYTVSAFTTAAWWTLKSVLFEELLFRGALLYILLKKTGERRAYFISALAFGIYHWFSYQIFGKPIAMAYVLITTGIWGYMFAYAFSRTRSLYLPIGLHYGWNLFNLVVFSQGGLGDQLLVHTENGNLLPDTQSLMLQIFQVLALPVLVFFYFKFNKTSS